MEDFGAHTNYCELALHELGYNGVFPHTGEATKINLHGKQVFPLVTGTFGAVGEYFPCFSSSLSILILLPMEN